jgi:hypothetical protein
LVLTFYGIPTEPGKSKVITAFFTNSKVRGCTWFLYFSYCGQGDTVGRAGRVSQGREKAGGGKMVPHHTYLVSNATVR